MHTPNNFFFEKNFTSEHHQRSVKLNNTDTSYCPYYLCYPVDEHFNAWPDTSTKSQETYCVKLSPMLFILCRHVFTYVYSDTNEIFRVNTLTHLPVAHPGTRGWTTCKAARLTCCLVVATQAYAGIGSMTACSCLKSRMDVGILCTSTTRKNAKSQIQHRMVGWQSI